MAEPSTAIIDVAGDENAAGRRITGLFQEFEKKRLILKRQKPCCPQTPVFVSTSDLIFLGEVAGCTENEQSYLTKKPASKPSPL